MGCVDKTIERPSGFHDVPENIHVWVHRDGCCINRRTGNSIKIVINEQGYKVISLHYEGKTINFYHHRLIARAFVERPARHLDKDFSQLEVNHIDGVKDNNAPSNLEWVTPEENIEHAIANGLAGYEIVLAKNIKTNEIKKFLNATECSRHFGLGFKRLQRHLRSKYAGYITKDWHVFKLLSEETWWPELRDEHIQENTWDKTFGVWIARSVEQDDMVVIADTLKELAHLLNLSFTRTQSYLTRHPEGTPYNGWIIVYDDFSLQSGVDRSAAIKERVVFPPKTTVVVNQITGEERQYASRNIAATALGIHPDKIRYALKAKDGVVGDFKITEQ